MAINFAEHVDLPAPPDSSDVFDPAADSSLVELAQHEFPAFFRQRNGRLFPSHGGPYPLPVDGDEQHRMNSQHRLLKEFIGANYVGPVAGILDRGRSRSQQIRVLDFCTGTGKWLIDMAQEFPHARFTGFDIVPIATRRPPSNVDFELHDVTTRSRFPPASIDLIHARHAASITMEHYVKMLDEAATLLRPGGLLLLCEWAPFGIASPLLQSPTVHLRAIYDCLQAIHLALLHVRGITEIVTILKDLVRSTNKFGDIKEERRMMPIGGWHPDPQLSDLGTRFRDSVILDLESYRQLLRDAGYSDYTVDSLFHAYREEVNRTVGLVAVYHTIWCHRL